MKGRAVILFWLAGLQFVIPVNVTAQQQINIAPLSTQVNDAIKFFPFKSIDVVDARADTSYVYIPNNNEYPAQRVQFASKLTDVFKNYIELSTSTAKKGDLELLLRIEQFSVPNIFYENWYRSDGSLQGRLLKGYLFFKVVAYVKTNAGGFQKFLSVEKKFFIAGASYLSQKLPRLMDELVIALTIPPHNSQTLPARYSSAQKKILRDTISNKFHQDGSALSYEDVSINIMYKWSDYPVVMKPRTAIGIYKTFEDFRNNLVTPSEILVNFNPVDSLYIIKHSLKRLRAWGVSDGSNIFIRLSDNICVKLAQEELTYSFRIPSTIPDMYALLSLEEANKISADKSISSEVGLIGIIASIAGNIITESQASAERAKAREEILKKKQDNLYRKCILHMDNGDIIF